MICVLCRECEQEKTHRWTLGGGGVGGGGGGGGVGGGVQKKSFRVCWEKKIRDELDEAEKILENGAKRDYVRDAFLKHLRGNCDLSKRGETCVSCIGGRTRKNKSTLTGLRTGLDRLAERDEERKWISRGRRTGKIGGGRKFGNGGERKGKLKCRELKMTDVRKLDTFAVH